MYYTRLRVRCDPAFSEILIAEVAEAGFDSFLESDEGFEAFVENDTFDDELLREIEKKYEHVQPLVFSRDTVEKINWNEEWEKNVGQIVVDDACLVRAEFHVPDKTYPYEIIITPKMSFGTGHHQTTHLMLSHQLRIDHTGKRVMDAGCGTAILSIMACKRGAGEIEAFDIDEWSVVNGNENVTNNHCTGIRIRQGKIRELDLSGKFDIILANINKNILLDEIGIYAGFLEKGGHLLMSGFYVHDIEDLNREAAKYGLDEERRADKETWAAVLYRKA